MRKRVAREWLWVVLLVITIAFALLTGGCANTYLTTEEMEAAQKKERRIGIMQIYSFEGHDYILNLYGGIMHSHSCQGDHR